MTPERKASWCAGRWKATRAERYYRAMLHGGPESWNIRDHHMADTLDRLMEFHGPGAKAVVWEHNTHVGDARATDMASAGMVNIGRLVRERHSADGVVLVGFGSYAGTLIASDAWGGSPTVMVVPPAREASVEGLLHSAELDGAGLFVFPRADDGRQPYANGASLLRKRRDHRAIGVVYHPEREKWGNYVSTLLGARYDAFCFLERTTALTPLHTTPGDTLEAETWPTGVQTASAESLAGARHGSASLVNRQAAGRR